MPLQHSATRPSFLRVPVTYLVTFSWVADFHARKRIQSESLELIENAIKMAKTAGMFHVSGGNVPNLIYSRTPPSFLNVWHGCTSINVGTDSLTHIFWRPWRCGILFQCNPKSGTSKKSIQISWRWRRSQAKMPMGTYLFKSRGVPAPTSQLLQSRQVVSR